MLVFALYFTAKVRGLTSVDPVRVVRPILKNWFQTKAGCDLRLKRPILETLFLELR
jgi:hypothetical protein